MPEAVKEERYARIMERTAAISAAKLQARVGRTIDVIIDEVGEEGATGRSTADAPEIDGQVHLRDAGHLSQGAIVSVEIEDADEHDLYGVPFRRLSPVFPTNGHVLSLSASICCHLFPRGS